MDCLPTALLENATQKVLDLLTSKVVNSQPGCTDGGWYASRVRGGLTTTIPGLAAALRSGFFFVCRNIRLKLLQVAAETGDLKL